MGKVKRAFCLAAKIIVWAAAFAAAALPAVYLNSIFGYFPVLFMAFLVITSAISMQRLRSGISVHSDFTDRECERGKDVGIGLKIYNRRRILCPKASAHIFISDLFGKEDAGQHTLFTMPPKEDTEFEFDMAMPHIGVYHAGVKDVQVYDFTGFFKKTIAVDGDFEVYCRPRVYDLDELLHIEQAEANANRETRVLLAGGSDYSGVRDYAIGDSMKYIHWKLSAHSQGYMTKLYESSRQTDYAVILDFAAFANNDAEELMDVNDCLIELALSVITEVAKQHTGYALIYCNKDKASSRRTPKGREDDLELVRDFSVITPDPPAGFLDAAMLVEEESSMSNRAANLIVCTSRVTDELVQQLLRVKRQGRSPMLLYVVPAGKNSREIEKLKYPLRHLEEASVAYELVSTAVNTRKMASAG